jgi:NAD+ synthase (glutamine-hydrolysing)
MNEFSFVRLTAATLKTRIADPEANAAEILAVLDRVPDSDVVVFPELAVTAYTCGDLFGQSKLLESAMEALLRIAEATKGKQQLIVVGAPLAAQNSLYNCGVAISGGEILGVVPKQFIPNYKEFYESRWFSSATGAEPREIVIGDVAVPFGIDLLFQAGRVIVGVEICEDLWMPIPPSSYQAVAGANVLVNLSASNETIGKNRYRTDLVTGQSGRCIAAYAYSSAGPTESTTDLVFGGHCLIAENGTLISESRRVGDGGALARESYFITADIDVERLQNDRRMTTSFDDCVPRLPFAYRRIEFTLAEDMQGLERRISGTPFIPREDEELHRRCAEIFGVQTAALARRVEQLAESTPLNIGVSGGLDSTLALLVAVKTCELLGFPAERIHALTMPGFGTTEKTRTNAVALMRHLGVSADHIDIRPLCLQAFRALGHDPFGIKLGEMSVEEFHAALRDVPLERRHDLVFENVQARIRTFLLMSRGFVVGTGDLSESALGWSTYNGDHMSMYNPNCSIPKTLVRFLVRYAAMNQFDGEVYEIIIGLEVHVQLQTATKLFCRCSTRFGAAEHADLPGLHRAARQLPVMNREAFQLALKTAVALNCQIPQFTKWDRKQYYYPDLPKGYQISQFDLPMSQHGWLEISDPKGAFEPKKSASSGRIWKKTPARACTTKWRARRTAAST